MWKGLVFDAGDHVIYWSIEEATSREELGMLYDRYIKKIGSFVSKSFSSLNRQLRQIKRTFIGSI